MQPHPLSTATVRHLLMRMENAKDIELIIHLGEFVSNKHPRPKPANKAKTALAPGTLRRKPRRSGLDRSFPPGEAHA